MAGIGCGLAVHGLFAFTVYHLFFFLRGDRQSAQTEYLAVDALLALQFALPHSWLLLPGTRQRLGRWISPAFYGLFYCAATCASLLLMFALWSQSGAAIYRFEGWPRIVAQSLFIASWVALLYSLHLTGLGYQTGLTPWLYWVRRVPAPRRNFTPRGAYLLLRHPVYLSFLGLVWFTPDVTLDRVVLAAVWTPYIFLGSWLKDRRLLHYLGDNYRGYYQRVAGYPGFGALASIATECRRWAVLTAASFHRSNERNKEPAAMGQQVYGTNDA